MILSAFSQLRSYLTDNQGSYNQIQVNFILKVIQSCLFYFYFTDERTITTRLFCGRMGSTIKSLIVIVLPDMAKIKKFFRTISFQKLDIKMSVLKIFFLIDFEVKDENLGSKGCEMVYKTLKIENHIEMISLQNCRIDKKSTTFLTKLLLENNSIHELNLECKFLFFIIL